MKHIRDRRYLFMEYLEKYREWLENPYFDEDTKAELREIAGDDSEIK